MNPYFLFALLVSILSAVAGFNIETFGQLTALMVISNLLITIAGSDCDDEDNMAYAILLAILIDIFSFIGYSI